MCQCISQVCCSHTWKCCCKCCRYNLGKYLGLPVLVCFNTGRTAVEVEKKSDADIKAAALASLRSVYGTQVRSLAQLVPQLLPIAGRKICNSQDVSKAPGCTAVPVFACGCSGHPDQARLRPVRSQLWGADSDAARQPRQPASPYSPTWFELTSQRVRPSYMCGTVALVPGCTC
jgi:hypothetical protein